MSYERVAPTIFRMASDSNAEKFYLVDVTPGRDPHCECMSFAMNRNKMKGLFCKHTERAYEILQVEKAVVEVATQEEFNQVKAKIQAAATLDKVRNLNDKTG